jgi:two-component system nitrogen regulation response regulator GlnG
MPAELQTRLLRVLSDGNFYRVGGHQPVKANVRVIAATHQDLEGRVKEGLFREDLFHRLNVIRLRLPPLRERRDDIPLLAKHFLQKSAQELGGEPKRLTEAALKYLQGLDFPGNVRQLENLCHWLTVMAPGQSVDIRRPARRTARRHRRRRAAICRPTGTRRWPARPTGCWPPHPGTVFDTSAANSKPP